MDGFLPLIEGFLAFALTMLALTTAVSALVGASLRIRRRRARGLRDMVRLLYLREVKPLLPEAASTADAIVRRTEFISDMTLMPLPVVVDQLELSDSYWKTKLESAELLAGKAISHELFHPVRMIRRWRTLRYGLEALTDAEFTQRLDKSEAGKALKTAEAWNDRDLGSWEEFVGHLLKIFQTIGEASSETFARHSRSWSVLVGFLLAFGVNVDSFDLLNSYLIDPELRAGVIQDSEAILSQQTASPAEEGTRSVAAVRDQLKETSRELGEGAEALVGNLEAKRPPGLSDDEWKDLVESLNTSVQGVVKEAAGVLGELEGDLHQAEREVLGVARALTTSLPVGWRRYPNCTSSAAPDLRCAGRIFNQRSLQKPDWLETAEEKTESLPAWMTPLWVPLFGASQFVEWGGLLASAREASPADFFQWLSGVILTGVLLGLGAPFWVQTVSRLMSLRRWVNKDDDEEEKAHLPAGRLAKPDPEPEPREQAASARPDGPDATGQVFMPQADGDE